LVFGGQFIRSLSMYTAGSNFHHGIRYKKTANHELITYGIYTHLRHPAYFGWFWWSVGTQILLRNPISVICYALASWMFFHFRIREEEKTLIHIFGDDYIRYQKRTYIGIPFI